MVKKRNWLKPHDELPWLQPDEVPATRWRKISEPKNNALSVWYVEDESDIDRIVAAMSTTKDHISNVDYRLLDVRVVVDSNFPT